MAAASNISNLSATSHVGGTKWPNQKSVRNGRDLSGCKRRHRHCLFKTTIRLELILVSFGWHKYHLKHKEFIVLSHSSKSLQFQCTTWCFRSSQTAFLPFVSVSKQLELQFRSLGLSFMSKTAQSRDMQGDHIKATINADVIYMWPLKFMVGYLVLYL